MIAGQQGEVGEWLAATSEKPLALDFSEGTRIEFGASSRGRVEAVTPEGALVTIERGSLSATVTHRKHTSWRFGAGPFEVIVGRNQPRRPLGRKYRRVRAGRIARIGPGARPPNPRRTRSSRGRAVRGRHETQVVHARRGRASERSRRSPRPRHPRQRRRHKRPEAAAGVDPFNLPPVETSGKTTFAAPTGQLGRARTSR